MRTTILTMAIFFSLAMNAATTDNNDSCDIAVLPAATLLLPYFEVDVNSPSTNARSTLFTIVNTSRSPQIARVTLWTDLGYPVFTFNVFLTGYDAQPINLYDVVGSAAFIQPARSDAHFGDRSLPNYANPNFAADAVAACAMNPGPIPDEIARDIRSALTHGDISACGRKTLIGLSHNTATGYATIDLVKTCGTAMPTDEQYYSELLYDNVLTGDYQMISPNTVTGNYASGNPLVHIRAVSGMPHTFYDRYTPGGARTIDRRQPLPALFAARFIQGGTGAFNTNYLIWREGVAGRNAACLDYYDNDTPAMEVTEAVRFDEHENSVMRSNIFALPETSSTATSNDIFPPMSSAVGDTGGWMYLNLTNAGSASYSSRRASQNWVVTTMSAEGRYSVMFDATMLGNGCTNP